MTQSLDTFLSIDDVLNNRSITDPISPAIVYAPLGKIETVINYKLLNNIVSNLGKYINYLNNAPEKKIVIFGNRTPSIVIAIFGTFRSDSAYSIIDTCHPIDRIKVYLDVLKPDICITCEYIVPEEIKKYFSHIITIPENVNSINNSSNMYKSNRKPDNTAVYTFTSGSTGIPKCVMGRHSSIVTFYPKVGELLSLDCTHRYGMLSGISHDPLQRDIFTPIYFGATIYIPEQKILLDADKITDWININLINIICVTPSMLQILISANKKMPTLTHIFSVGERLFKRDAEKIFSLFNGKLINMYGSTESQRAVSMFILDETRLRVDPILKDIDVIPSGKGIGPVELLIINDNKLVSNDDIGEIYIQSKYLSKGYYRLDKETRERFITNPLTNIPSDIVYKTGDLGRYLADGNVLCMGRTDNQVKVRGYRIELSEIDICLSKHNLVENSITLLKDVNSNNMVLTWVKSDFSKDIIIEQLRKYLPHYMVPDDIIHVNKFEVNHNNKIDTSKLPDYKLESKPICIEEILDFVIRMGYNANVNDNLLEYGISSLEITCLVRHINQTYNKNYKIADFYKTPILKQFLDTNFNEKLDLQTIITNKYKETIVRSPIDNNGYNVFLTGCTGFLGSHLLVEYLANCRNQYKRIYVHVRAKNEIDAINKIEQSIYLYHGRKINNINQNTHLCIVLGDLSKPMLGIDASVYESLTNNVNMIVHNGAEVDWLKSYKQLEQVNVNSTVDIINMATKCKTFVKLNFISTTAIFDNEYHNNKKIILNHEIFPDKAIETIHGGYAETKYVADALVRLARRKGIICNVFRTGYLICDTINNKWIDRDFLVKLLKYCVQTKTVPSTPRNNTLLINLMPVDLAKDIIIKCSEYECNKDINLVGPKISLINFLNVVSYHTSVQYKPYTQWVNSIPGDTEIGPLKDFMPDPEKYKNKKYDTSIIKQYVLFNMINLENILSKYIQTIYK